MRVFIFSKHPEIQFAEIPLALHLATALTPIFFHEKINGAVQKGEECMHRTRGVLLGSTALTKLRLVPKARGDDDHLKQPPQPNNPPPKKSATILEEAPLPRRWRRPARDNYPPVFFEKDI
jgi:hypothetical protein